MGGDGTDDMVDVIIADSRGIGRKIGAECMNGPKFHGRDTEAIIGVKIGGRRSRKCKFGELLLAGVSGEKDFGSKSEGEVGRRGVVKTKLGEERLGLGSGEDGDVVDGREKGADVFAL